MHSVDRPLSPQTSAHRNRSCHCEPVLTLVWQSVIPMLTHLPSQSVAHTGVPPPGIPSGHNPLQVSENHRKCTGVPPGSSESPEKTRRGRSKPTASKEIPRNALAFRGIFLHFFLADPISRLPESSPWAPQCGPSGCRSGYHTASEWWGPCRRSESPCRDPQWCPGER